MTRRLSVLFVQTDCGGGVPPAVAIARRLREQGHAVRFLAARSLESQLTRAGFAYEAFQRAPDFGSARRETDQLRDWEARTPIGAVHALFNVMCGPASAHAADVLASLKATPTDVVACDFMLLGAFVGAEAYGIPNVALVHTVAVVPLEGLPPIPYGLQPAHGPLGRGRDEFLRHARDRVLRRWLHVLNDTRARYQLAPVSRIYDQWFHAQRLLILSSPTFDFAATRLPENVRYVGPASWEAPTDTPLDLPEPSPTPLVLASLSTTYQAAERYLRVLITALGSLPVSAVVTTGAGYDASDLAPLPHNIVVSPLRSPRRPARSRRGHDHAQRPRQRHVSARPRRPAHLRAVRPRPTRHSDPRRRHGCRDHATPDRPDRPQTLAHHRADPPAAGLPRGSPNDASKSRYRRWRSPRGRRNHRRRNPGRVNTEAGLATRSDAEFDALLASDTACIVKGSWPRRLKSSGRATLSPRRRRSGRGSLASAPLSCLRR